MFLQALVGVLVELSAKQEFLGKCVVHTEVAICQNSKEDILMPRAQYHRWSKHCFGRKLHT